MRASPHVGWSSVARIFIVVVLPAPLGPMKPKQSPSLISRFRFDSATSVPYRFVRLTVLMTAAMVTYNPFIPHPVNGRPLHGPYSYHGFSNPWLDSSSKRGHGLKTRATSLLPPAAIVPCRIGRRFRGGRRVLVGRVRDAPVH